VSADGAIRDGASAGAGSDINVVGTTTLVSTTDSNIVLDDRTNEFAGSVSASGADITGTLNVSADGAIRDGASAGAGSDINVAGASTLVSTTDDNINLDDGTNEFVGAVSASGANISLGNANAIELADIDATGSLDVSAGGEIGDGDSAGAGSDIDVAGETTLVSTANNNITLDDETNDFVGPVSASGANISLKDSSAIELADIDASGTLKVSAAGAIRDGASVAAGSDINVAGATSLVSITDSNIVLDDGTNDFAGSVSASGANISLADTSAINGAGVD